MVSVGSGADFFNVSGGEASGNTITAGSVGITSNFSDGLTVRDNTITGADHGIAFDRVATSSVTQNTVSNTGTGIYLSSVQNVDISGNQVSHAAVDAFYLNAYGSSGNVIHGNVFRDSATGIAVDATFAEAPLASMSLPLAPFSAYAAFQIAPPPGGGAVATTGAEGVVFGNRFINNSIPANVSPFSSVRFYNPLPEGGNTWDTYDESSEGCVDADHDGFCDSPYVIDPASGVLDQYPHVANPCAVPGSCVSNVLFLPGIEGSTLYDEAAGKTVWLSDSDATADDLRLDADGTSVNPNITASGVIASASLYGITHTVYGDLLQEMQNWQTKYNIIATSTPYDWRLGYDTLLTNGRKLADGHVSYLEPPLPGQDPYLIQTLEQLASTSPTHRVTIIAHSNGGLLAKALMQKLGATETAKLVDNVILVASPQLGTPAAVEDLLNGKDAGIFGFISDEKARELAQNMPMTYDLLPSEPYFTYVDDPVVTISSSTLPIWANAYGSVIHWAQGLYNFIADTAGTRSVPAYGDLNDPQIGNANLLSKAQVTHASIDSWTPPTGVHLYTIAGWGNETLAGINYLKLPKQTDTCAYQSLGGTCAYYKVVMSTTTDPQIVIDGDGTVAAPSAMWANGSPDVRYFVNLNTYNGWLESAPKKVDAIFGTHHDNIFNVPQLRSLLTRIVTASSTTSTLLYISTSTPQYTGNVARLHFILHSPLTLGFEDSSGQYTGSTATSTEFSIPGVDYQRFGEVQWLSVPKSLAGTVVMHGTGTGSFALDVQEQDGNTVVASTTFAAISSATSTIATLDINPAVDPTASSTLVVDYNGDGVTDMQYHAERGALVLPDFVPPEATIGFSTTTQNIEVVGTDDRSSATVTTAATSTIVTDKSGNWLRVDTAQKPDGWEKLQKENSKKENRKNSKGKKSEYVSTKTESSGEQHGTVSMTIRALDYSTGTTTTPTTRLMYLWSKNKRGSYTSFSSSVTMSSKHIVATYVPRKDKTYVVITDRMGNNERKGSKDVERSGKNTNHKVYNGLYIPMIKTEKGMVQIN